MLVEAQKIFWRGGLVWLFQTLNLFLLILICFHQIEIQPKFYKIIQKLSVLSKNLGTSINPSSFMWKSSRGVQILNSSWPTRNYILMLPCGFIVSVGKFIFILMSLDIPETSIAFSHRNSLSISYLGNKMTQVGSRILSSQFKLLTYT